MPVTVHQFMFKQFEIRLKDAGLCSRKSAIKTMLKDRHIRARLAWARMHIRWTRQQWRNVLFTDESRFCLHHVDGRLWVWCRNGNQFPRYSMQERVQGGGESIMVCGGISLQRKTIIPCNLKSQHYITSH